MTDNKRPDPVDLSQFEGMTPGPWGSVHNVSNKYTIWAGPKAEYIGVMNKRRDARAVESIPDLIADLEATRAERDKAVDILNRIRAEVQKLRDEAQKKTNDADNDVDESYWVGVRNGCADILDLLDGKR